MTTSPHPPSTTSPPERGTATMDAGRAKFTFPPESRPLDGLTIKRAVHRGGFGEVYYALTDAGKEVALKLLHQHTDVELRGARQCLNLNHPNLVTIYDIRRDGEGDWWILMEYCGGRRLADVLADRHADGPVDGPVDGRHRGGLPVEEVEHWLRGMTAGLTFLHDRGIVHRDLKPANIFAEDGRVKVGDVGLSKFISESRKSAHTQSVGTVHYMAPEVGRGRYGREVDVYALAVMLFEMYTGTVPFDGETAAEVLMKHLTSPPDLSPLPTGLRPVFERALAKDPAARTPTVERLEQEFRAAVRAGAGTAPATPPPVDSPRTASRPVQTEVRNVTVRAEHGPASRSDFATELPPEAFERAATRRTAAERPGRSAASGTLTDTPAADGVAKYWKYAALALVLVAFFSPRLLGRLASLGFELAIVAALGYGAYRVVRWLAGPSDDALPDAAVPRGAHPHRGPPVSPSTEPTPAAAVVNRYAAASAPAYRPHPSKPVVPGPKSVRGLSGTRRAAELTGSMTTAALLSIPLTALLDTVHFVGGNHFPEWPMSVLFAAVTTLGSWAVLFGTKPVEGTTVSPWLRRLTHAVYGAGVGAVAWVLSEALLVDTAAWPGASGRPLFESFAGLPLRDGAAATPWAFALFFAALFGARRWWWHADGYRPLRLRIRTVLMTALAGLLAGTAVGFPAGVAVLWAVAISVVTQLSAVWTPPQDRGTVVA